MKSKCGYWRRKKWISKNYKTSVRTKSCQAARLSQICGRHTRIAKPRKSSRSVLTKTRKGFRKDRKIGTLRDNSKRITWHSKFGRMKDGNLTKARTPRRTTQQVLFLELIELGENRSRVSRRSEKGSAGGHRKNLNQNNYLHTVGNVSPPGSETRFNAYERIVDNPQYINDNIYMTGDVKVKSVNAVGGSRSTKNISGSGGRKLKTLDHGVYGEAQDLLTNIKDMLDLGN
jgi:hypothetical protein